MDWFALYGWSWLDMGLKVLAVPVVIMLLLWGKSVHTQGQFKVPRRKSRMLKV